MFEIVPWIQFGRPLLLTNFVDLDVHLYYAAIQNLVTDESSDTPSIDCLQNVQKSVDMYIQLPVGLQSDLVQMAEVV